MAGGIAKDDALSAAGHLTEPIACLSVEMVLYLRRSANLSNSIAHLRRIAVGRTLTRPAVQRKGTAPSLVLSRISETMRTSCDSACWREAPDCGGIGNRGASSGGKVRGAAPSTAACEAAAIAVGAETATGGVDVGMLSGRR